MEKGYIRLHRQLWHTSFYKNSYTVHLAIHLILKANWEDKKTIFNKKEIIIPRGSLITGRKVLAAETGISESTITDKLEILKNTGFCNIKSNNKFSIISIVKYNEYNSQKENTNIKSNNQPTTSQQLGNTSKEFNNLRIKEQTQPAGKDRPPNDSYLFVTHFYKTLNAHYGTTNGDSLVPAAKQYGQAKVLLKRHPLDDLKNLVEWYFDPPHGVFWGNDPRTFSHFVGSMEHIIAHILDKERIKNGI